MNEPRPREKVLKLLETLSAEQKQELLRRLREDLDKADTSTFQEYRGWKYREQKLNGKVIATDLFDPKGKSQWAWHTPG